MICEVFRPVMGSLASSPFLLHYVQVAPESLVAQAAARALPEPSGAEGWSEWVAAETGEGGRR